MDAATLAHHQGDEQGGLFETLSRAVSKARRVVVAHKAETLAACLLLLMAVNLVSVVARKTITNDEIVHIPAGYYHLVDGYFQLNNEHPPLVKMWAALPLLLIQPNEPPAPKNDDENFMERTWGFHARFWPDNKAQFDSITFWPRIMMLPITLGLGLLIFIFTRRLFGSRAALLAVALYSFEPTVLAHGRIVHTDVPAACAYLLFFFALHAYASAPTLRRALLVGLVAGVAFVTKFSMVVALSPVLLCLALAGLIFARRLERKRAEILLHAGLAALVILLVVNAAYYFQSPPIEPSDVKWVETKSAPAFNELMTSFRVLSKIVPTYFLFGLYNVVIHNQYGHAASLLGMHSDFGWWYYFPVAFALKTSLPFLLVSIGALLWSLWRLLFRRDWRFLFLVAPVVIFTAFSMTSHINIGIRHFLPVFPFLFIIGGALLDRLLQASRTRVASSRVRLVAATALVVCVLSWTCIEALRAYPDYVPYMNQLARRPHWEYLSDSNIEWGDDAKALAAYLRARGETQVRGAMSGAWGTLNFFGVQLYDLIAPPDVKLPETRYVAIGASFLNGSTIAGGDEGSGQGHGAKRVNKFAAYRTRQPEAIFGGSIYLYREK